MEIWRPVFGFEGFYEISNFGKVRSCDRFVKGKTGKPSFCRSSPRAIQVNRAGYHRCNLFKDGKAHLRYVHRLVAEAFIPPAPGKDQVNHKDGVKSNNHVSNLEWVDCQENCHHALKNELYQVARGEDSGAAKITAEDVIAIRRLANTGIYHRELADMFGIGRKAITKIVNRQRWKHI